MENVKFIKGDVNDNQVISSIFYGNSFDYVFHYAAVVGVKRTIENPIMVLDDLKGLRNVLDLCKNTSVKRIFFSSLFRSIWRASGIATTRIHNSTKL